MEKAFIKYEAVDFATFEGVMVEIFRRDEDNIIISYSDIDKGEKILSLDREFIDYIYDGNINALMEISQKDIDKNIDKREYMAEDGEHVEVCFRNPYAENVIEADNPFSKKPDLYKAPELFFLYNLKEELLANINKELNK